MKKIITSLLLIVCFGLAFSACSDGLGEKYYQEISKIADTVFLSEEFESVYDYSYTYNMQVIMNSSFGEDYLELKTVFHPVFISAVSYAYKHYSDLTIATNLNDSFRNSVSELKKDLDNFNNVLGEFIKQKEQYEANITFADEAKATSDIEKTRLILFKRDYITLIESAKQLSDSVFNARRLGCYDFSNYQSDAELANPESDVALAINTTNLQIVDIAIKVMRTYNAKKVASTYENYYNSALNFYNQTVEEYENNEKVLADQIKEKLSVWQGAFELFKQDAELFVSILNNINISLLETNNYDAHAYAVATGNPADETDVNYFNSFYEKLNYISQYSNNLFN